MVYVVIIVGFFLVGALNDYYFPMIIAKLQNFIYFCFRMKMRNHIIKEGAGYRIVSYEESKDYSLEDKRELNRLRNVSIERDESEILKGLF